MDLMDAWMLPCSSMSGCWMWGLKGGCGILVNHGSNHVHVFCLAVAMENCGLQSSFMTFNSMMHRKLKLNKGCSIWALTI